MESEARRIHGQAATAREAGESLKALKLDQEALLQYIKDEDKLGLAEIHAEMAIVYGHIAAEQNDPFFKQALRIDARNTCRSGVEIAELSGDKTALAIPYLRLGKAHEELGETGDAVTAYKKAVANMEQNPPSTHDRPAVLADMRIHLHTAEYKNGDATGLEKALSALNDLESTDEPQYNKAVWMSGAHMRIANMLQEDDLETAKKHLQLAKGIIDSNPDLKIRLSQWEKLAKDFN